MKLCPHFLSRRAVAVILLCSWFSAGVRAGGAIDETTASGVVELLAGGDATEAARGEKLLATQRPALVAQLLQRIAEGEPNAKGKAAAELGILISPWVRRGACGGISFREQINQSVRTLGGDK